MHCATHWRAPSNRGVQPMALAACPRGGQPDQSGMRVLAMAYKPLPLRNVTHVMRATRDAVEADLIFVGYETRVGDQV